MLVNTHTVVYSCLWMFPGWLGSDKSSTSAPRCHKCALEEGERELSEHAAYTACPNQSTTRTKPPALPSIISSIPPLADELDDQKLHFRSKWPVLARFKSKGELSVSLSYPLVLCAGATYPSTQHCNNHIIMMHVTSRVIWNRNLSSRQP